MHVRTKVGNWGERVALRFLEKRGLFLVEQNARTRFGEIDIVIVGLC